MALRIGVIRSGRYLERQMGIIHPEHPDRLKYAHSVVDAEFSGEVVHVKRQSAEYGFEST